MLSKTDIDRARRWFAFLRNKRREIVPTEWQIANLLGCDPCKVFNAVAIGPDDDVAAFDELLRIAGHAAPEPEPMLDAYDKLLELLKDRQYRRGKHG